MNVYFTGEFVKNYKKLRGNRKGEVDRAIEDITANPKIGKPLRYSLKGLRSYRVGNLRIIYTIEGEDIYFITFGDRKKIYEDLKKK